MLILKGCLQVGCDALSWADKTRPYEATLNAGGYGVENEIADPAGFDTYTFTVWDPTKDYYTQDPTKVIDLKADIPTPDADGDYIWPFTALQLGVATVDDGIWWYEAKGVFDDIDYVVNGAAIVTWKLERDIKKKIDARKRGCKPCENDAYQLWLELQILKCGGICDISKAAEVIKSLQAALRTCC